jgi:hypothetical protein
MLNDIPALPAYIGELHASIKLTDNKSKTADQNTHLGTMFTVHITNAVDGHSTRLKAESVS